MNATLIHFLGRCLALGGLLAVLSQLSMPTSAHAQDNQDQVRPDNPAAEPDRWLTENRWGELRYGLTIREPKQADRIEQTRDGALARWSMPNGSKIGLTIYRGVHYRLDDRGNVRQERIHLNTVVVDMVASLEAGGAGGGGTNPITQLQPGSAGRVHNTRSDQWLEVGDLLGYANYFLMVPAGGGEPWLFGIALLQLDDTSMMVLRLECPRNAFVPSICTFESMVHSVRVESAGDVSRRMRQWVDNGEALLASISDEQYEQALRADRLFRIVESNRDIGYQRVWQRRHDPGYYDALVQRLQRDNPDAQLEGVDAFRITGNAMVIQTHYEVGNTQIDTMQEYVEDQNGVGEYWQIKSSLTDKANPHSDYTGAWVETGLRGMANFNNKLVDRIQVVREGTPPRQMTEFVLARERDPERRLRFPSARPDMVPSGDMTRHSWATPPKAYISAIDAMVLPALLPADRQATYAFFAYHIESTTIAWRIMRVQPLDNGGKLVHLRPTIDLAEQTIEYDANNELVRWTFHDGRQMLPTTREELNRIWRARNTR